MAAAAKRFSAADFTPYDTVYPDYGTAEAKARFANHFIRFVESDFKRTLFPKWFYNTLNGIFGHIAHFNIYGFYATFFTDTRSKVRFLRHTLEGGGWGSPTHTYCDVEAALKTWVRDAGLLRRYTSALDAEITAAERVEYDRLKAKFDVKGSV